MLPPNWITSANLPKDALLISSYQHRGNAFGGIEEIIRLRRSGALSPVTLCSFHSFEHLAKFPEHGILHEPSTGFVRLPCTRETLQEVLSQVQPVQPGDIDRLIQERCTTWGQFHGYLTQCLEQNPFLMEEVTNAELERFCRKEWGSEFARLSLPEKAEKLPDAVLGKFLRELRHGGQNDLSNKTLAPIRAALLAKMNPDHIRNLQPYKNLTQNLAPVVTELLLFLQHPISLKAQHGEASLEFSNQFSNLIQLLRREQSPITSSECIALIDSLFSILKKLNL